MSSGDTTAIDSRLAVPSARDSGSSAPETSDSLRGDPPGDAGGDAAAAPCPERSGWRSQFARPRGFGGRLAGWLMARKNGAMNARCVEWLAVAPADRVLEIGFGHGRTLAWLAERAPSGVVVGIDPSPEMLRMAARRNRAAIQSGRVQLARGTAEVLPFPTARFDKLLAVNCVQFWDLPRAFAEAQRVLRPGGVLLIGVRMRETRQSRFASPGFSELQAAALRAPLRSAGFALREERARAGGREVLGMFATRI
jgi:SAM-dependent methyltransferase